MAKYFTTIGSRTTPKDVNDLLEEVSYHLLRIGFVGRSGGCSEGPDHSLTKAVIRILEDFKVDGSKIAEIIIPWDGAFNLKHGDLGGSVYNAEKLANYGFAIEIAKTSHYNWDALTKRSHKALHTRNSYQPLGITLNVPSGMILTYCPITKGGYYKGGTASALNLSKGWLIPILNCYLEEDLNKVKKLLEKIKLVETAISG